MSPYPSKANKILKSRLILNLFWNNNFSTSSTYNKETNFAAQLLEYKVARNRFFCPLSERVQLSNNKVAIIGTGAVGTAISVSLLATQLVSELVMVSLDEQKFYGEVLDLLHCAQFMDSPKIISSTDLRSVAFSRIIIIAVGPPRTSSKDLAKETEKKNIDYISNLKKTVEIVKEIAPMAVSYAPEAILLIVSNPGDILTQVCIQNLRIPKHKIIGTGCEVDSARLRYFIGEKYGVAASSCGGWVIGGQGDASDRDVEDWSCVHEKIKTIRKNELTGKGHSTWSISLTTAEIVKSILRNSKLIFSLNIPIKGIYGIDIDEVCVSLPCVLGENGISDIVLLPLGSREVDALCESANCVKKFQRELIG